MVTASSSGKVAPRTPNPRDPIRRPTQYGDGPRHSHSRHAWWPRGCAGAHHAQPHEYAHFSVALLARPGGLFRDSRPRRRSALAAGLIDVMHIQESVSGVEAHSSETRTAVSPSEPLPRKWSPEASGRRRPMIAVLIHYIERTSGGYEQMLRTELATAFRQHDFDFTVICGAPIDDPGPDMFVTNELYRLVDEQHFDGAILVSTGLCRYIHPDRLLERLPKLRNLALSSIGLHLKGIPSVTSDAAFGMSAAVEHLIRIHGRRQLAFLGAQWHDADIERRREVFLDVTRTHGLEVPPHRLIDCWLEPTSGELAVIELLRQDPMVDAIVAGNDGAAMGAVAALKRLGRRVPQEISVTGFDDLPMALFADPSIATVSQRIDRMATLAVENIA
jgi:DNA-binding LacI/PurR family transcriptional regulator